MFLIWINNKRLFELKLNEMFFLKKIILKMLFLNSLCWETKGNFIQNWKNYIINHLNLTQGVIDFDQPLGNAHSKHIILLNFCIKILQKTSKILFCVSVWSVQDPNAIRNIQHPWAKLVKNKWIWASACELNARDSDGYGRYKILNALLKFLFL